MSGGGVIGIVGGAPLTPGEAAVFMSCSTKVVLNDHFPDRVEPDFVFRNRTKLVQERIGQKRPLFDSKKILDISHVEIPGMNALLGVKALCFILSGQGRAHYLGDGTKDLIYLCGCDLYQGFPEDDPNIKSHDMRKNAECFAGIRSAFDNVIFAPKLARRLEEVLG